MFDFLKNLTKSDEEKQQEAFSAYLDDTISPSQRQAFELRLAEDADLRAEMELAKLLRQQMREMPRRSVPRSFMLDANAYGVPRKEPLVQAYPLLRAATVMTAFFFVLALGLSVFTSQSGGDMASVAQSAMAPAPVMEEAAEAPLAAEKTAEGFVETEAEMVAEEVVTEEAVSEEAFAEEAAPEEEMPAAAMPLPMLVLTAPADLEMADEAVMESDASAAGAASADAIRKADPTPTLQPTATVSALPRLEATQTAVPRAIEATVIAPGEIANAVGGETAVSADQPIPESPPSRSLTTSQVLLIGLGLLLLILLVVTLLTRRKI